MNTRFLATLRTVAEVGSLAAAARQLNLAVASVSEQTSVSRYAPWRRTSTRRCWPGTAAVSP